MAALKSFTKTKKPKTSPPKIVDGVTVESGSRLINQNELLRARINKIKCDRSREEKTPKSPSTETPTSSPSNGNSTNKISSNKIQSNKISSASSTPLVDQKSSMIKQKAPSAEVASSSRSLNRLGNITTVPVVQSVEERNV